MRNWPCTEKKIPTYTAGGKREANIFLTRSRSRVICQRFSVRPTCHRPSTEQCSAFVACVSAYVRTQPCVARHSAKRIAMETQSIHLELRRRRIRRMLPGDRFVARLIAYLLRRTTYAWSGWWLADVIS
jgi:hypothetical protein